MSFLTRLLGIKSTPPDPTLAWPSYQDHQLILTPHEGRLEDLKFGDPIANAKSLGKPSKIRWVDETYISLIYAQAGFQIDFEKDRLVYMAFYTDRHEAEDEIEGGFKLITVSLKLADGRAAKLSKASKRIDIEDIFGIPSNIDYDSAETILYFTDQSLTIECEMQPNDGTLMRMNLFPTADSNTPSTN